MNAVEAALVRAVDKAQRDVGPCAARMANARDAYYLTPDSLSAATLYLRESRRYCKAAARKAEAARALHEYRREAARV